MKVEIEENLYIESDKLGFQVKKYNGTRFEDVERIEKHIDDKINF